jgi:hypothetical protein
MAHSEGLRGRVRGVQIGTAGSGRTGLKFRAYPIRSHEMRTTLPEHASDRRDNDAGHDEPEVARDNPRRQREPDNEREDDDRLRDGASRSPRRHCV